MRDINEVMKKIQDFAEAELKDAFARCDVFDSGPATNTLMSEDNSGNQINIAFTVHRHQ